MSVDGRRRQAAVAAALLAQQRLAQTRSEIASLILPHRPPSAATRAAAMARARAEVEAEDAAEAAALWRAEAAMAAAGYPSHASARPAAPFSGRAPGGPSSASAGSPIAWSPVLRRGLSIWWRHHPAHAAFEVADSMLSHVARRKPWLILGIAAGAGALVAVARPWRLVSITGLAFAALRMTDVRGLFGSLRDHD